jgi:hypothetical protein
MSLAGDDLMTTDMLEPRFERFCLAYPSGTVVMHYGGGVALGEVRVAHPLAVVEAVEVSWVNAGILEAGRFEGDVSARMPRSEVLAGVGSSAHKGHTLRLARPGGLGRGASQIGKREDWARLAVDVRRGR